MGVVRTCAVSYEKTWSNPEGLVLKQLQPNLFVAERPYVWNGIDVGGKMAVVKLSDGSLWVHSPVNLDADLKASLKELGPVKHIVVCSESYLLPICPILFLTWRACMSCIFAVQILFDYLEYQELDCPDWLVSLVCASFGRIFCWNSFQSNMFRPQNSPFYQVISVSPLASLICWPVEVNIKAVDVLSTINVMNVLGIFNPAYSCFCTLAILL